MQDLWQYAPRDAFDLEREFEMQKRQVDHADGDIRLKLPKRLQQFSNTEISSSVTFDHIYVDHVKFKAFFEDPKNRIISLIKQILVEIEHLDQIILVGGFSCSRYLYHQIKNHADLSHINVCCPKEPGLAVVQGAVLFGYHPDEVKTRICRYTYGFGVLQDFDETVHKQEKRDIVDGEDVCKDVFDILVYEGEKVHYDTPKCTNSKSSHRQADRKYIPIRKEFYAGKNITKKGIVYVTEDGIRSIGKIISQPPEGGWTDLVEFKTNVYFGQTEIKIEDIDTTNNLTINVEFDWL